MTEQMFFSGWDSLLRTLVVGVLAYVTLIVVLRISGKRTLSKMNAFDLIVTVALGSTLATVLLTKDVALAEGVFALALLIGLQFVVSWTSVRARWVRQIATGEPLMLLYCGTLLPVALRHARVTEDEVRAAIRSAGVDALKRCTRSSWRPMVRSASCGRERAEAAPACRASSEVKMPASAMRTARAKRLRDDGPKLRRRLTRGGQSARRAPSEGACHV